MDVHLRKIFRATNGLMNRLVGHRTTHPLVFHYIRAQDTNFLVSNTNKVCEPRYQSDPFEINQQGGILVG